jgi:hypothetical protein
MKTPSRVSGTPRDIGSLEKAAAGGARFYHNGMRLQALQEDDWREPCLRWPRPIAARAAFPNPRKQLDSMPLKRTIRLRLPQVTVDQAGAR